MKKHSSVFIYFYILLCTSFSHAGNVAITDKDKEHISKIILEVDDLRKDAINDLMQNAIPFPTTRSMINAARLANANYSNSSTSHKIALALITASTTSLTLPLDVILLAFAPFTVPANLIQRAGIKYDLWPTRYQTTKTLLENLLDNNITNATQFGEIKQEVSLKLNRDTTNDEILLAIKSTLKPTPQTDTPQTDIDTKHEINYKKIMGSHYPSHYKYKFPLGVKALTLFIAKFLKL